MGSGRPVPSLLAGPTCLILDLVLSDGSDVSVPRHVRDNDLPIGVAVATGTPSSSGRI